MKQTVGRIAATAGMMAMIGLGFGIPSASAEHDDHDKDRGGLLFVYAAKVICNPTIGVTTTINVHNPNEKSVTFTKKGIALGNGQVATAPGPKQQEALDPDYALQMGCDDLQTLGAVGTEAGFGDAVIESSRELDVWAVYLTGGGTSGGGSQPITGAVLSTQVVRVPPTRVRSASSEEKHKK
jgi:hypothetical protein